MKNKIMLFALISSLPVVSLAEEAVFTPSWYGGLHIGKANTELNDAQQEFSFLNVGGNFGYRYTKNISVEGFLTFASDEEKDHYVSDILATDVGVKVDAMGVYVVGQSSGDLYVKGRVGLAQTRFSYDASGYESESEEDIGFSYGIGAGAKINSTIRVELEYIVFPEVSDPIFTQSSYESDMFSLSVVWDFSS